MSCLHYFKCSVHLQLARHDKLLEFSIMLTKIDQHHLHDIVSAFDDDVKLWRVLRYHTYASDDLVCARLP